jgi:DNA-directed RNA polymerase III subunit RPC4
LNESYGVFYREPQEENKALTIDKKLMTKLGSLQSTYGPGSGTKAEKQGTPVQVAFGRADPSIPRTFPTPRSFSSGTSAVKLPKEHNEPWVSRHKKHKQGLHSFVVDFIC